MNAEREKAINEWLGVHCPKCANNDDRGTDFLNCQAECEEIPQKPNKGHWIWDKKSHKWLRLYD